MKPTLFVAAVVVLVFAGRLQAQRRPGPPPSRYSYTLTVDAKTLPKGVTVRTIKAGGYTRHFIKNTGEKPLVINRKLRLKRLIAGTKLVSGKVYQYFPNGVPMAGKTHLKGWQAPFGVIKETLLRLPKDPDTIYKGRKAGLSRKVPADEAAEIPAHYDGKPRPIKVRIRYRLNPKYDVHYGLKVPKAKPLKKAK